MLDTADRPRDARAHAARRPPGRADQLAAAAAGHADRRPDGGPSDKIKHVFYVVRENRTYDQIFGSDPRGRGDPRLQLFDDNGVPGPTGGVTPNAHALSRRFSLLDNVYANSEESTAGHKITAGGYANDYTQRYTFTNRGRKGNPDIFPIGVPPNAFIFDQAVRQGLSFRDLRRARRRQPAVRRRRPPDVRRGAREHRPRLPVAGPGHVPPGGPGARPARRNAVRCTADAGEVGRDGRPAGRAEPRARRSRRSSSQQLAAGHGARASTT